MAVQGLGGVGDQPAACHGVEYLDAPAGEKIEDVRYQLERNAARPIVPKTPGALIKSASLSLT